MNTAELKNLLELATSPQDNAKSIYAIAEVLREEIRKKYSPKNIASRDLSTLISIFDGMYYETIDKKPEHLLQLLPTFHFLCCEGEFDWKLIE